MAQIHELIPKITAEVKPVGKDHENKQQNYKFRSIDDVYNVLHGLLGKHSVGVFPSYEIVKDEVQKTQKGSLQKSVLLKGTFKFTAPDDSSETTITYGEAIDYGDKAFNKAMSASYKYALFQTFCIPTEEDKDSEEATPEIGKTGVQDEEDIKRQKIDKHKVSAIEAMIKNTDTDTDMFCSYYGIEKISDMNNEQWITGMKTLEKKEKQVKKQEKLDI
jgi:hypothetical protein